MPGIPATLLPPSSATATTATAATGLLTSNNCQGQVHLIVGSNAIAAARAQKSIEAGAMVKVLALETEGGAELHYGLRRRIEDGEVEWVRRKFVERDLETLGRKEVDGVVDLVWVTVEEKGVGEFSSVLGSSMSLGVVALTCIQYHRFRHGVNVSAYPSTAWILQRTVHSLSYPHMRPDRSTLASQPLATAASSHPASNARSPQHSRRTSARRVSASVRYGAG